MSSRALHLLLTMAALTLGCEEERRAWVSILPIGDDDEETADGALTGGPLGVSGDGRAVVLGADTLFTADRLPAGARGALGLDSLRFERVVFSPDSSRVAFSTAGSDQAVGLWTRTGQIGVFVDLFRGGRVDSLAWSPEGHFLAWSGRGPDEIGRVSIADAAGRRLGQPMLEGLAREGRSVDFQGWTGPGRARVLVRPAAGAAGGLAYVWDARLNNFILESHIEPLVQRAPGQPPAPGGIFSVDLVGDAVPETVALYRSASGAPAALVLEERAGEFRARTTDPLVEPADTGLERWEDGTAAVGLYAPLRMNGEPLLLLELPSPARGIQTIAVFRVEPGGSLEAVTIVTPEGVMTAIFQDGRVGDENRQLGVIDLDHDGDPELVAAIGTRAGAEEAPSIRWRATVLDWEEGTLVARPGLEAEALARIAQATGGAADTAPGASIRADTTGTTP